MTKEQEIMLLGVLCKRTAEEEARLDELISSELDWAYIVGILVRHRIDGNFYCGISYEHKKFVFPKVSAAMKLLSNCYRAINIENLTFLQGLFEELSDSKIRAAGLKGVIFNTDIYNLGVRKSNDIDLMVGEKDLKSFDEIMRKNGFIQSLDGGHTEASRKEKMIQIMNYHDLVPYYKRVNKPYMDSIKVDINFHFDEKEHDITESVFDYGLKRYEGNGFIVQGLHKYTHLIHLCIHYFREATDSIWVNKSRDLDLYKIIDIENTVRQFTDYELTEWVRTVKTFEVEKKCYYTFYYLNIFYPNKRYEDIMKFIKPIETEFLDLITVRGKNEFYKRERNVFDDTFSMRYGKVFGK